MKEFKQYRRKEFTELRPYVHGELLPGVSISDHDRDYKGSPKLGDMIARNPKHHTDQWLVEHDYFLANFEEM